MKKIFGFPIIAMFLLLFLPNPEVSGQDATDERSQMLDVKLQLLDSKLQLLDAKIKLWEAKPAELDIRLQELDSKIKSLDFKPEEINRKLEELDSMISHYPSPESFIPQSSEFTNEETEPEFTPVYNSAIMLDPMRLLEGTFCLSYERVLDPRFSINVSGMATYSTSRGLSNMYFKNQSFDLYSSASSSYEAYSGEVMSGGGFIIQFRNYLRADHPGGKSSPLGLYAAPQFMYRNMKITGNHSEYGITETGQYGWIPVEIHRHLNVFSAGAVIGIKIPFVKVLALDFFAGGSIRLSKYKDEKKFTRYHDWSNFDFSGVSPIAGITVGILK
jgi:hypothetical protein